MSSVRFRAIRWKAVFLYACTLLLATLAGALLAITPLQLEHSSDLFILVGAVLATFVCLAILIEWRLGIFLFGVTLPFEDVIASGTLVSGVKALGLLTFVSVGLRLLWDRGLYTKFWHLLRQPLVQTLLAFGAWTMVSILWATNPGLVLPETSSILGVMGLVLTIGLLEEREIRGLWVLIALSTALSVPLGYVLSPPERVAESGRFTSGGSDPNDYAGLLVIVLIVAYYVISKRFSWIKLLVALSVLTGIFISQSRTGLLVLLATPLIAVLMPTASKRSVRLVLIVYGLAFLLFTSIGYVAPVAGEALSERYETLSEYQSEETWAGRLDLWDAAFRMTLANPFFGVGAGNFTEVGPTYSYVAAQLNSVQGEGGAVAHNAFLSVASELGLVGLALFSGVLFLALKYALAFAGRGSILGIGLLSGLIAYAIICLTLTWEHQKVGYFILGSILALHLSTTTRDASRKEKAAKVYKGS